MSNTKKQNSSPKLSEKYSVRQTIVNYYLVLMFTVFPLFFTDAYFNIRHDKYYLFLAITLIVLVAEGCLFATVKFSNENNSVPDMKTSGDVWYKKLSFPDWAMLALLASSLISTVLSDFLSDSIFGTAGRNNGLLLIAVYVGIYFLITRCFYYLEYIFIFLAAASSIVFLLAILNCFYVDPLGMFDRLTDEKTITDFTSTIGNKNLMSSYICITLPVLISISVLTKRNSLRILYLVASGLGFAALMTADSDSGILGIGIFLVIYFIWFSRKIARLKRYFLTLTIMLAFGKLLRLFSLLWSDNSKGMDSFQELFVYSNTSYILLAVTAVITALLYLFDYKKPDVVLSKAVPIALGIIAALGAAGLLSAVVYFSTADTSADLGGFESILRFNDKWGTHRGFMWIRSMWIFNDSSFMHKLFGTGPDTFYYTFSPYFSDLMQYGDTSTNAAHNEYINYLITIGITGLASYLALVVGVITRAVKAAKKNPLAIICVSAVICYSIQAIVNITQPITTPLFILFLALSESVARQTKLTGKSSFDIH